MWGQHHIPPCRPCAVAFLPPAEDTASLLARPWPWPLTSGFPTATDAGCFLEAGRERLDSEIAESASSRPPESPWPLIPPLTGTIPLRPQTFTKPLCTWGNFRPFFLHQTPSSSGAGPHLCKPTAIPSDVNGSYPGPNLTAPSIAVPRGRISYIKTNNTFPPPGSEMGISKLSDSDLGDLT